MSAGLEFLRLGKDSEFAACLFRFSLKKFINDPDRSLCVLTEVPERLENSIRQNGLRALRDRLHDAFVDRMVECEGDAIDFLKRVRCSRVVI